MPSRDKKLISELNNETLDSLAPIAQSTVGCMCLRKFEIHLSRKAHLTIALFHFFNLNARIILNTPAKINDNPVHAMMFTTPKAGTANIIKAKKTIPIANNKNQPQFESP